MLLAAGGPIRRPERHTAHGLHTMTRANAIGLFETAGQQLIAPLHITPVRGFLTLSIAGLQSLHG